MNDVVAKDIESRLSQLEQRVADRISGCDPCDRMVCLELRTGRRDYQVAWIGTYRDVYEKAGAVWKLKSRAATVKHTPMLEDQR
jgi:hypothetical protein